VALGVDWRGAKLKSHHNQPMIALVAAPMLSRVT